VFIGHDICGFLGIMADPVGPKPNPVDADNLSRLLELELIQKRATWKQAGERYRSIRTAGFVFLFVMIVGCLIGGYFAFMRMNESRPNQRSAVTDSVPDR
jgi:hypothetical protein